MGKLLPVLLFEGDDPHRELAKYYLKENGVPLITVTTAAEALRAVETARCESGKLALGALITEVIFSDGIHESYGGAYEALIDQLDTYDPQGDLPVIAYTTLTPSELRRYGFNSSLSPRRIYYASKTQPETLPICVGSVAIRGA